MERTKRLGSNHVSSKDDGPNAKYYCGIIAIIVGG